MENHSKGSFLLVFVDAFIYVSVTVKLTEWVVGLCSFVMFVFLICISELHQGLHGGWAALASELSLTMNCNFSQAGSRPPS